MNDAKSLREQAKRCRTLSETASELEVIEQLRVWAVELAEEAEQAEWRISEREEAVRNTPNVSLHRTPAGITELCSRRT
jgi:hypothetical protein